MFGEVRKGSETDLVAKFKITQFPSLVVVTDPDSFEGEAYQGEFKIDRLTKFLNTYSYKTAVYEKKLEFHHLTADSYKTGLCKKKSSNICLLFFTQSNVAELLKDQIKGLLDYYKKDPVTFVWVDKHEERGLHNQFEHGRYHLVVYKPKRDRFLGYSKADFSNESLRGFIDDVLGGGGGEWQKFEHMELQLNGAKEDL